MEAEAARLLSDNPVLTAVLVEHGRLGFFGPAASPLALVEHALRFAVALRPGQRLADLGSGGGVPGLVLACSLPGREVLLVEGSATRADALVRAVGRLGLGGRVAVDRRPAERVGRDPDLRESLDAVVARSFGPPAVTAEAAAPLLRTGGQLVVSEPPGTADRWPAAGAVANQKGGVGKTTTAVNLGACLADLGYRVLVVDLDPQGNASTGLGINIRDLRVDVRRDPARPAHRGLRRGHRCGTSSWPRPVLDLAGAEIELVPAFSRELRLKRALEEVADDYDFVLIDCPPSLGLLTVNGLAAATEVVVPIQCEYYALEGLGQLLRNVDLVQKNLNPTARGERHRPGDVRRPDQAGRPGGPGGAGALRRQGVPERGAPDGAAVRGARRSGSRSSRSIRPPAAPSPTASWPRR
jgi:16S rRNA G527 N7-methylase RsmG